MERQTSRFTVSYYVRPDFDETYAAGSLELSRLERQIEDEFIANLQHSCYRERSYRECLETRYNLLSVTFTSTPCLKKTVLTYFLSELCQISTDCENFWHKGSKENKLF